ncbi:MAG: S41 family peptidase [Niabella sp.]
MSYRISSALICIIILMACSKKPQAPKTPDPPASSATEAQLIADSVYLFSKEIYYWQDVLPAYSVFNPGKYVKSDAVGTAQATIEGVRSYSNYDKEKEYSYATDYEGDDAVASSYHAGQPITDYGFYVKDGWKSRTLNPSSLTDFAGWYITYVYPDSDAGKKGIARGMKILKINSTTLGYNDASIALLNNMFAYGTLKTAALTIEKQNGETFNATVGITSFTPSSVLMSKVLTTATGKKVGYFVYNFFDKYNSDTQSELANVFQSFKDAAVTDIVLDLRYNLGGYTRTQDEMANYLAPASANDNKMYEDHFNDNMQKGNYSLMKTRDEPGTSYSVAVNTFKFNNANKSLDLPKLYVIVGHSTASSSELLINNLKPKFGDNLVLIGDENTYGKPVGFFPVDLFKKVTFYTVSFITKNSSGESVSFDGFKPDYLVYDAVDKNWGDMTEDCLKTAINLIDGKSASAISARAATVMSTALPKFQLSRKQPFRISNMIKE